MCIAQMSDSLREILKGRQTVLICYPQGETASCVADAVRKAGSDAVAPGEDFRWRSLLRLAFSRHVTAAVGPSRVILGLRKLSKATGTPLAIRDVILIREAPAQWMLDSLRKGLDCRLHLLETPSQQQPHLLHDQLLSWSGILDYRAEYTDFGLDLEVVSFPGEKIPQLPSCAKLNLRHWNPENDAPFSLNNC